MLPPTLVEGLEIGELLLGIRSGGAPCDIVEAPRKGRCILVEKAKRYSDAVDVVLAA